QNARIVLVTGHGRQRFLGEGQQLRRTQRQFTADDLPGNLLHQLEQLFTTRLLEIAMKALEAFDQPIQRLRRLVEGLSALGTAFFMADGLAVIDAALEAFAIARFAALLQPLLVPLVDAFLKTFGDGALQCCRIASQAIGSLCRGPDPRRKAERAPGTAFAFDDLDAHRRLLDRLFAEQLNLQLAVGGHFAQHRHAVPTYLFDPRQRYRTLATVDRFHLLRLALGHRTLDGTHQFRLRALERNHPFFQRDHFQQRLQHILVLPREDEEVVHFILDLAHQLLVVGAQQLEHLVTVALEAIHDVRRLLHATHLRALV